MGQSDSTLGSNPASNITSAFHILRVAEKSPAALAGIEPFFDFLCGVNQIEIGQDIDQLSRILESHENRTITLQIYSSKRRELRDVNLIPSRTWSSQMTTPQPPTSQPSLLGLSLRLCNPQNALDQVYHVLSILASSPAESAGLVPYGDYIIGYSGGVLRGEGDFYDIVEKSVDRPLRLFVYNCDYDITREAILVPNRNWGGEGLLGCGVGYGLLHRIPRPQDREGGILVAPEESQQTIGDDETEEDDIFVESRQSRGNSIPSNNSFTTLLGNGISRTGSDGYEQASYSAPGDGFDASDGVEIVAKPDEFDSYVPEKSYNTVAPPPKSNNSYGYGNASRGFGSGGGYGRPLSATAPPRSPSSGLVSATNVGVIGEEEEGEQALDLV